MPNPDVAYIIVLGWTVDNYVVFPAVVALF